MYIKKLQINNFRNIENQFLEFSADINYFVAPNSQGKTSLIEAIYYISHNKSFKTKELKSVIQNNKKELSITAITDSDKIKITKNFKTTKITINQEKALTTSVLTKKIPIQLIIPDNGFLVGGTNKNKRYYLDWGMFHVEQDFIKLYKKYKKVQQNINSLINKQDEKSIDLWFLEFAKLTEKINKIREKYLNDLSLIDDSYFTNMIMDLNKFNFKFHNGFPSEVKNNHIDIYNFLLKNKKNIFKNKYLKYGSHLAKIEFNFQNKPESQLSRGEQKTLSIIFWLKQVLYLISKNIKPIVLIDDLSSELDDNKIKIIISILEKIKVQSFITSINPISSQYYQIKNGEIAYNK